MLPIGSLARPEYTTSRLTGRVTFFIVRSPAIRYWSCAARSMRVLLKVIVGKRSTSRKSGDFRCPSRCLSCVFSVAASTVATTEEAVKKIIFVEGDLRGQARESPFDGHDTHVLGGKLHLSVHRIDGPRHGRSPPSSCMYNCLSYNS